MEPIKRNRMLLAGGGWRRFSRINGAMIRNAMIALGLVNIVILRSISVHFPAFEHHKEQGPLLKSAFQKAGKQKDNDNNKEYAIPSNIHQLVQSQMFLPINPQKQKQQPQIRACLGPLFGSSINWNAIVGWILYHEKRWGLTTVDIFVQGTNNHDSDDKDLLLFWKDALDNVTIPESLGTSRNVAWNLTSLPRSEDPPSSKQAPPMISLENPTIQKIYQQWIMNQCLQNAQRNQDDYALPSFDANEYLISDTFSTISDMFTSTTTTKQKSSTFHGIAFPKFVNNYHRCSVGRPTYGSTTFQTMVPLGAERNTTTTNTTHVTFTNPGYGALGQRKYIIRPNQFDHLLGIHDPFGDGKIKFDTQKIYYMTGRREDEEHARIIHYQTDIGLQTDRTYGPCQLVRGERATCPYLSNNKKCVNDTAVAYFENVPTSVNALLKDLYLNSYVEELYPDILCYAKRYPDLHEFYCKGNTTLCPVQRLYFHYQQTGNASHLLWGCLERNTTFAVPVWDQFSKEDQLRIVSSSEQEKDKLHILVFETDEEKAKDMVVLSQAADLGIEITVFGANATFNGFGTKWHIIERVLKGLSKNTIVFIIDGRDVLLNIHKQEAKNIYGPISFKNNGRSHHPQVEHVRNAYKALTLHKPGAIVVAAGAQCCVSALDYKSPGDYFNPKTMKRNSRACATGKKGCGWRGDTYRLPWEKIQQDIAYNVTRKSLEDSYMNAGLVAGRPDDLLNFIKICDLEETEDDQAVFTDYMYYNPNALVLDYAQEIFGIARWRHGMDGGGCVFNAPSHNATFKSLIHRETKTSPLFLHTPGKFLDCFYHMTDLLELGIQAPTEK